MKEIIIKNLTENNLKKVNLNIPKNKIVVFTGVSGSGKSSIVFDTIAAESQRQMNETYSAFVRGRLPKYKKPQVEFIDNLSSSVIVDQSSIGSNIRSTVGTISDLYTGLRVLFSRIGTPYVGTASYFSFNDPNGMCKKCSGLGKVTTININAVIDFEKSWNEGCVRDTLFKPGSWYWNQYAESKLFDFDKPVKEYTKEEYDYLIYGTLEEEKKKKLPKLEGLFNRYSRAYLKRDLSNMSKVTKDKTENYTAEEDCDICHGRRLSVEALNCKILNYSIADVCDMELVELYEVLKQINNKEVSVLIDSLKNGVKRMIDIGLPYLHLNRQTGTLSGGEAQRLKLVRYMGSSLIDMMYIFDEPSTGLHPNDVYRMNQLLKQLRDKGNTVLVVEHDKDVISIADEVIDVGPHAGKNGGEIVYQGSYENLLLSDTLTGEAMRQVLPLKSNPRKAHQVLQIRGATLHNLKQVDVDIPLGIMTVVTGVAGSGKSTLISGVFAEKYQENIIKVDQSAIVATNRSMPATFLGFFDQIRELFAKENGVDKNLFSFNSKGACPICNGKGVIITELVFMDPIVTECEACNGNRYSEKALQYQYKGKDIVEILSLSVTEALNFFEDKKIISSLKAMEEVGLSYMTLGQPLSTLSGGERQRMKLAKYMNQKGNIYILDEPTTGLHMSDIDKLMILFEKMVEKNNTVIIIEHNMDVVKQADWVIDVGPEGGKNGGQIVFEGTPEDMIKIGTSITSECLRKSMI